MEFLTNEKKSDFDTGILKIYWEDKEAFSNWKKSPEHKEDHKDKAPLPKEILDVKIETYELFAQSVK